MSGKSRTSNQNNYSDIPSPSSSQLLISGDNFIQPHPSAFFTSPMSGNPFHIPHTPIWNMNKSTFIPTPVPSPQPSVTGLRPNTSLKGTRPVDTHGTAADDDSTIGSNLSSEPMIMPCNDFSRYSYWLKTHFPHLMHKNQMNCI